MRRENDARPPAPVSGGARAAILLAALAASAALGAGESGSITGLELFGNSDVPVPGLGAGARTALGRIELYDAPEGGRLLWTGPATRVTVFNGRARFHPFMKLLSAGDVAAGRAVWVEFRVGAQTAAPRRAASTSKVPWAWDSRRRPYFLLKLDFAAAGLPAGTSAKPSAGPAAGGGGAPASDGAPPMVATLLRPVGGEDAAPRSAPPAWPAGQEREDSGAPPASVPAAPKPRREPAPGRKMEASLNDLRLSNNLYFEALRAYRAGDLRLAVAKLDVARTLNPSSTDIAAALGRMRHEFQGSAAGPPETGALPSSDALRRALDLYFAALRSYSKGELRAAQDLLREAAVIDPSDEGVTNALNQLGRELAGVPDVH